MNSADSNSNRWVHAGMYANSSAHQQAWKHWFEAFNKLYKSETCLEFGVGLDDETYLADNLFMAQSCGYPLIKKWSATHHPIAAATFDLPGCDEGRYSSWFVCHKTNPRERLGQFQNTRVAINSPDSNSGCNVLQYAVCHLDNFDSNQAYFNEVIQSGGHWNSLQLIAEGSADLAAIDCVSYALAIKNNPSLMDNIKIIGQSAYTMGLPFIAPKGLEIKIGLDKNNLCNAMDEAVKKMDRKSRELLSLKGFVEAKIEDYQSIAMFETATQQKRYAQLR